MARAVGTTNKENYLRKRQNGRRLWHLFWSLTKPFIFYAPGAKLNFLWVILLILIRSAFIVAFSFLSRDFWTALQHKDVASFWRLIRLFTFVLLCALPTLVWCDYAQQRLALKWRRWLTEKVVTDYFAQRNYYHLDQNEEKIDNPDQRISQDVESFTTTSLLFFYKVFRAVIDLFNFSAILFTINPQLFLVLIVYSSFGTAIAVLLGRRLINLNFHQLQKEADFRYALIRVRENAESIAFYRGENREKAEAFRRFFGAFINKIDLIVWTRNLNFFVESYTYLVEIIPLAIIAPLYFDGKIEMGVVSQAAQAFRHVLSDLSIIVNEFDQISAFSAGIDRLGELEEFMYQRFASADDSCTFIPPEAASEDDDFERDPIREKLETTHEKMNLHDTNILNGESIDDAAAVTLYGRQYALDNFRRLRQRHILGNLDASADNDAFDNAEAGRTKPQIDTTINPDDDIRITVNELTLVTPDVRQRVLFENVTFSMEVGEALLIAGPSGTGKSSLLRAIAGLWVDGRGSISRPSLSKMFFLPQKPYCTLGTLREQLVYPTPIHHGLSIPENDLITALDKANLAELPVRMGGLDILYDWANVLSLGEQQRLAFARLIVGKPALAILDECSSALDVATEQRLYAHLREMGITFISVGHRPTLVQYHDYILRLGGSLGNSFSLERIDDPLTQQM